MTLLGQEMIKATSKTLPNQPGVYQMQDDKGNILYIGKSFMPKTSNDGVLFFTSNMLLSFNNG